MKRILVVGRISAWTPDPIFGGQLVRAVKVKVDTGRVNPIHSHIRMLDDHPIAVGYALKECFNALDRLAREQEAGIR